NHTAATQLYTLSLHDALPISNSNSFLDKKLGIRHCQVSLFVPPGNVRPSEMLRSPATKAKPTRQRGVKIDHVWMLSYECAGIAQDRKSTRLNSSHLGISYAVF